MENEASGTSKEEEKYHSYIADIYESIIFT